LRIFESLCAIQCLLGTITLGSECRRILLTFLRELSRELLGKDSGILVGRNRRSRRDCSGSGRGCGLALSTLCRNFLS
jgi:hypothetical protein